MRIDRTSVGVLAVALVGLGIDQAIRFLFTNVSTTGFGTGVGLLIASIYSFTIIGLPFLYAFYLGKTAKTDSPLAMAVRFLAAGIGGGLLASLTQSFGPNSDLLFVAGYRFSRIVHYAGPFTLAGLAGVPLGSHYGDDRPILSQREAPTDGHPSDIDKQVEESRPEEFSASVGTKYVSRSHAPYWVIFIAVVAAGIQSVITFPGKFIPRWVAPVWWFVGPEWLGIRSGIATVVLYGIMFAFTFHLGKTGWGDSPKVVAKLYFVAGIVASVVIRVLTGPPLDANILGTFYGVSLVGVTFVLVGLAGVPFGRIYQMDQSLVNEGADEVAESQGQP